jgi:hypothetical protein
MERKQATFSGILKSDYVAVLCVLAPVVLWVLYTASSLGIVFRSRSGTQVNAADSTSLTIAIIATVICIPVLLLRIQRLQSLFACGSRVNGEITSIDFYRDRGRVEYKYSLNGVSFTAGAALHKSAKAAALRVGQTVELVVDPGDPKRALIVDLYC